MPAATVDPEQNICRVRCALNLHRAKCPWCALPRKMSAEARRNVLEDGLNETTWETHVAIVKGGAVRDLLRIMLASETEDRKAGWRDYVDAVCDAAGVDRVDHVAERDSIDRLIAIQEAEDADASEADARF